MLALAVAAAAAATAACGRLDLRHAVRSADVGLILSIQWHCQPLQTEGSMSKIVLRAEVQGYNMVRRSEGADVT